MQQANHRRTVERAVGLLAWLLIAVPAGAQVGGGYALIMPNLPSVNYASFFDDN